MYQPGKLVFPTIVLTQFHRILSLSNNNTHTLAQRHSLRWYAQLFITLLERLRPSRRSIRASNNAFRRRRLYFWISSENSSRFTSDQDDRLMIFSSSIGLPFPHQELHQCLMASHYKVVLHVMLYQEGYFILDYTSNASFFSLIAVATSSTPYR